MNFINVNWSAPAFVGNPIPSNKTVVGTSDASSYNSSYGSASQGDDNQLFEMDTKPSLAALRNSVSIYLLLYICNFYYNSPIRKPYIML